MDLYTMVYLEGRLQLSEQNGMRTIKNIKM